MYSTCIYTPLSVQTRVLMTQSKKNSRGKKTCFDLLSDDKILHLSKLKAFADDNFSVAQRMQFFCDRVENIVGKGENDGPAIFSKASSSVS